MSNYFPKGKTITVSKIKLYLAMLFGKKFHMQDEEGTVTFYEWRGTYYVTDVAEPDEHELSSQ